MSQPAQDELKKRAAAAALQHIESGMAVGLGGGSTAAIFIALLGRTLHAGGLQDIKGVPSAVAVGQFAESQGVPLTTLESHPRLDVCVDGADEVSPALDLIKGGGGMLTREKIVAQASERLVIVVDESKLSPQLGTSWPIPVETIEFGWTAQRDYMLELGARRIAPRRNAQGDLYRTDQGNLILDADFGPMPDPAAVARSLSARAGVVEHGLFLGMATDLITACASGEVRTERRH